MLTIIITITLILIVPRSQPLTLTLVYSLCDVFSCATDWIIELRNTISGLDKYSEKTHMEYTDEKTERLICCDRKTYLMIYYFLTYEELLLKRKILFFKRHGVIHIGSLSAIEFCEIQISNITRVINFSNEFNCRSKTISWLVLMHGK